MLKYHIFSILHPTPSCFAIMIHFHLLLKKKGTTQNRKKIINHVVSQFHLRQLILFLLAPYFGNLNFGMITENIERCHTYHEVSRHLKD